LVTVVKDWDDLSLEAVNIRTGKRTPLVSDASTGFYLPSGHLIFGRKNSIAIVPFDLGAMKISGATRTIIENVRRSFTTNAALFDVSQSGSLVYVPDTNPMNTRLTLMNKSGFRKEIVLPQGIHTRPRFSPNGEKLAFATIDPRSERGQIRVYDLGRKVLTQVIAGDVMATQPVWYPDGSRLVFTVFTDGALSSLFAVSADGSGGLEEVIEDNRRIFASSWSHDGNFLAYWRWVPGANQPDIYTYPISEGGKAEVLAQSPSWETQPAFSPIDNWIAYIVSEGHKAGHLWLTRLDGTGARIQVSREPGHDPVWAPDGKALYFRRSNEILEVSIARNGEDLVLSEPRVILKTIEISDDIEFGGFDISPDNETFVLVEPIE